MKMPSLPFTNFMHNNAGPNISSKIVNITPGKCQIHVSFTSEYNCETLAFLKNILLE